MASFRCIAATGKTIERVLNACYAVDPPVPSPAKAALVQTDDFKRGTGSQIPRTGLSIFLYRVEVNGVMRAAWSGVGSYDGQAHLPLDLHYLMTAWAENAQHEHEILGKTMQCLDSLPNLSGPMLYPSADWATNEAIYLTSEDFGLEALMRTFDSLDANFRLSVFYRARIVRLDGAQIDTPPTVATVIAGLKPEVEG